MSDGRRFDPGTLPHTLVKATTSSTERFSLLLLEFGEIYFEDFSVISYRSAPGSQPDIERKQRGRLKLCSESILFDPIDFSDPVIKISFRDCHNISQWRPRDGLLRGADVFVMEASQVTEMLEANVIAPYKFRKEPCMVWFSLNYGSIDNVLTQLLTLHKAARLPKSDKLAKIEQMRRHRWSAISFNRSWLEDIYEETICELPGERITPLVSNPGRVMLTSARLYFQPYNNVEVAPVLKVKLSDLKFVMKRRYMLRHMGMELFCSNGSTIFLVFYSVQERNLMYNHIIKLHPSSSFGESGLMDMTYLWQTRKMSNFDYLMLLNFLADRSFCDIMQYPVMPWVIADYTSDKLDLDDPSTFRDLSKPIGALNEERLAFFKERHQEMSGRKFLYGTHYSAPGYVLYYLVRAAPEYLLCLQNGNFDKPNRLFHCIAKTWENVNTDHADVKELIPEFYQPPGNFLNNQMDLDLGVRTDGVRVANVVLPPWAKDSTDFVSQCRDALESEYVSQRLHLWINLIFGYQQKGPEALKADNLFHYLTYEGTSTLDFADNPEDVAAMELQIKEFGQTPKQIFRTPHAQRLARVAVGRTLHLNIEGAGEEIRTVGSTTQGLGQVESPSTPVLGSLSIPVLSPSPLSLGDDNEWVHIDLNEEGVIRMTSSTPTTPTSRCLRACQVLQAHKGPVHAVCLSHDGKTLFSVSHDRALKVHLLEDDCQLMQSSRISSLPLSSLAVLPDSKSLLVGSWDNSVYLYSVDCASVMHSTYCHHSSVTCLTWKDNILVTGSWDSTVKIWSLELAHGEDSSKSEPPQEKCEFDHDSTVTCLDLDSASMRVVSGTKDGFVTVWSVDNESRDYELQAHNDTVHAVLFSPDGSRLCTCGGDGIIRLLDLHTKCELLLRKTQDNFRCAVWRGELLFLGSECGQLHVWNASTLTELESIAKHTGAVTCLAVSADMRTIVSGGEDKSIVTWTYC